MPTTYLTDILAHVRIDLHDEVSASYRWSDATLTRHIERALTEYSRANPLTTQNHIHVATDNSREFALTDFADVVYRPDAIFAVEWPYDVTAPAYPPNLVPFHITGDVLYLHTDTVPQIDDIIRFWYTIAHTLSDATRTFPSEDTEIITLGAAAYAALEREIYAAERITVDGDASLDYQKWGTRAMTNFREALYSISQKRGMMMDTRQVADTSHL